MPQHILAANVGVRNGDWMAEFSADHRWWWTGEAWAPSSSPDGSIARWDGFRWVRKQDLTPELRILSAIGLLVADVIYVAVVLFILLLGASDVSGTDVPVKSLLVFGIAVAQVVSAAVLARLFRRAWWALALLAAWPFWVLLVLVAVTPDTSMSDSTLPLVLAIFATLGIAWLAAYGTAGRFCVTADGQWWGRPDEWYSTLSADGTWRWVGDEWRKEPVAVVPAVLATEDWEALASNQAGRITQMQLARRIAGFGWVAVIAPWRFAWADGRSLLWWLGCLPFLPVAVFVAFVFALISCVAYVAVAITGLIQLVDTRLGVAVFEGELSGVAEGQLCLRGPVVVNLRCPQRVRSRLVDGARYRVYRTRLTRYLVNFERLNAEPASRPAAHSSIL